MIDVTRCPKRTSFLSRIASLASTTPIPPARQGRNMPSADMRKGNMPSRHSDLLSHSLQRENGSRSLSSSIRSKILPPVDVVISLRRMPSASMIGTSSTIPISAMMEYSCCNVISSSEAFALSGISGSTTNVRFLSPTYFNAALKSSIRSLP